MANPQIPGDTQRAEECLALLHLAQPFGIDLQAVAHSARQTRRGRRIPGGQAQLPGGRSHRVLGPPQLRQGRADARFLTCSKPRPVLAEVVDVGAVDDGVEASPAGDCCQAAPQLGLAEVAPVGAVPEIARIFQLAGVQLEQRHVEPRGQVDGGAPLDLGIRRTPSDRRQEPPGSERLVRYHGEQRGIDPAGIPEEHLAEPGQVPSQDIEVCHGGET